MYLQLRYVTGGNTLAEDDPTVQPVPTLLVGAVGGLLVGITSVGSGSLIMVALLLIYPTLSAVRLVGTDLVQAVPLVLAAADQPRARRAASTWAVLIPLIVGGTPGTFLGARMAAWVSQSVIRRGIVIVLTLTGLKMLGVPPEMVGIIGAGLLLLGPLAWGFIRQTRGLPAFDNNAAAWRIPATRRRRPRPSRRRRHRGERDGRGSGRAVWSARHSGRSRRAARPRSPARRRTSAAAPARSASARVGRRGVLVRQQRLERAAARSVVGHSIPIAGSSGWMPCSRPGAYGAEQR